MRKGLFSTFAPGFMGREDIFYVIHCTHHLSTLVDITYRTLSIIITKECPQTLGTGSSPGFAFIVRIRFTKLVYESSGKTLVPRCRYVNITWTAVDF